MSSTGQNINGVRYYQQGQYHSAIQHFQQALANNPGNADAYYNLGATYHHLGRQNSDRSLLTQAEGLYHQCLDLSPDNADCYRALAVLLVQSGREDSAFTLLQRWAMRSSATPDARIELARLYEEFGDRQTAKRYLAEALEIDPTRSRAWAALGRLRESDGQYAQALTNYQHAYNLNRFQPGVAHRIAALQKDQTAGGFAPDTRTVTNPRPPAHW